MSCTLHRSAGSALDRDVFGRDDESRVDVDGDICAVGVGCSVLVGDDALITSGVSVGQVGELKFCMRKNKDCIKIKLKLSKHSETKNFFILISGQLIVEVGKRPKKKQCNVIT